MTCFWGLSILICLNILSFQPLLIQPYSISACILFLPSYKVSLLSRVIQVTFLTKIRWHFVVEFKLARLNHDSLRLLKLKGYVNNKKIPSSKYLSCSSRVIYQSMRSIFMWYKSIRSYFERSAILLFLEHKM